MDEASQQFLSENTHSRGPNISRPNVVVVRVTSIDFHYLLDANDDNVMVYGMTQHSYSSSADRSPVALPHARHTEIGIPFLPPFALIRGNYLGNQHFQPAPPLRPNHQRSPVALPHARHTEIGIPFLPPFALIRGNYLGNQHFQPAPPLRPNHQLASNNIDGHHVLDWYQSLPISYVQAPTPSANVSSLENSRMDLQRYGTAGTRRHHRFSGTRRHHRFSGTRRRHRFSPPQYHGLYHHAQPMQEIRGHSNITAPSYRVPTNPLNSSSMPIQNNLAPEPFLQDDEVPSLFDHHSDMHLDINDMSYEELLGLGERIGQVDTGLLEEVIVRHMRTKTYLLPDNLEGSTFEEDKIDLCIICQDEYKNKEEIGILECGHEYHADCIKRWLHEKNVCPLCKSKALTVG